MPYADPEKRRAGHRSSNKRRRAAINSWQRAWRRENPERVRAHKRSSYQKSKMNPLFRMQNSLRSRLSALLRGKIKESVFFELLGMDLKEFRIYLQGQFRPGMTWENYGPVWHIDHIRPCASFDLTKPEQQRECFRWENFQPLFADENLRKGARC